MPEEQRYYLHPAYAMSLALFSSLFGLILSIILCIAAYKNNWTSENSIPLLAFITAVFALLFFCFAAFVFYRRNQFKMVTISPDHITFKQFDLQRRRSLFDLFFHDEWTSINWEEVSGIKIEQTIHQKKGLVLYTQTEINYYIPFLFWNKQERVAIYNTIQEAINSYSAIKYENNN